MNVTYVFMHIWCNVVFAQETSNKEHKTLNCDMQVVEN